MIIKFRNKLEWMDIEQIKYFYNKNKDVIKQIEFINGLENEKEEFENLINEMIEA